MKKITSIIILLLAINLGYGQTTLSAGDIVITGFNSDNPDSFSFVLLTDVTNTTSVNFTDHGWQSAGIFNTLANGGSNEGTITWTATSDLPCGTEIIITDGGTLTASEGTAVETNAGFNLAISGDQILAYQGTEASPMFIYAVHFHGTTGWSADAIDAQTSAIPTSLTNGTNAVAINRTDNAAYDCSVVSDNSAILTAVSTSSNWNISATPLTLGSCYFSCVACSGGVVVWNGTSWTPSIPNSTNIAVIDAPYTTTVTDGSFSACSLIINMGNTLLIDDGYYVEVQNDVTINGNLSVENHGAFVQRNDNATFSLVGGNAVVQKTTSILNNWYEYTYWSSPINGLTIATSPLALSDRIFWFNAANYLDGNGDDIDDDGDDWQVASGTDLMAPGVGFAASHSEIGWFGPLGYGYDFSGEFNNGIITTSIAYNGANGDNDWNLIGNPYPCALDFDAFYAANSSVIDGAAYLWSHRSAPSNANPGNEELNFSQNDYAIITAGSGSINNSDNGDMVDPNDYIPSGQGFFISGLSGGTVTFNNSMRMADGTSNSQFFKNQKEKKESNVATVINNKLWLNLTSDNGVFNQILVAYVEGATNSDDGMVYDAPRNLGSGNSAILYSLIEETSNKKFAIQGKSLNSLDESEIVNLGFKTNIGVATLYKLSIAQLQGDFLTNNTVYLKDNFLNKTHNLSESDYTFTSEVGEFNERFEIVFNNIALSTAEQLIGSNSLKIVDLGNDDVQFSITENLEIQSVTIYDLLGRNLNTFKGSNSKETFNLSTLSSTVFIAEVALSNGVTITKRAIKR